MGRSLLSAVLSLENASSECSAFRYSVSGCFLCSVPAESRSSSILGRPFSKIAAVWPLLFAGAYILFLQLPGVIRLFSFLESAGKDLTSRMEIWLRALRLWLSSPIFGAYAQASGGLGSSQFHNTHLDILVSYGPIVLCIVCFALYSLIYMSGKRQSRQQFLFTIGFTCEIILGVGEAAIFSGGLGVYLYAGTFLLLRNLCQPEAGMEAAP